MRLTAVHAINAPVDFVFKEFTNFSGFEAHAQERELTVERTDSVTGIDVDMEWQISGMVRGKHREVCVRLDEYRENDRIQYTSASGAMSGQMLFEFEDLGSDVTEVSFHVDPKAESISSRLILQSIRLAKNSVEKRITKSMRIFGEQIEAKYISG